MWRKIKNYYHIFQAVFANIYFDFPSREIKVIGVTGTDGKTTTTWLTYHLLKSAGKKVSFITSIYAVIGDEIYDVGLHVTTPSSFTVQKLLRRAVNAGSEYFVLETTSHALDQSRVYGIRYFIGALTNITKEHLDYHKTFESYRDTKLKLLQASDKFITNFDDPTFAKVSETSKKSSKTLLTYGENREKVNFSTQIIKDWGLKLADFNYYNYACASLIAKTIGIDDENIKIGCESFILPKGRMEKVYDIDFQIYIDFAHTPNAITQALASLSKNNESKGRLIHVFGSAGLRDAQKREAMGKASASGSDISIITEEDYRSENLEKICAEIAMGLEKSYFKKTNTNQKEIPIRSYLIIPNRQDAIDFAIKIANKGDIVIATGKGHEKSLARGSIETPWSEHEAFETALKKR